MKHTSHNWRYSESTLPKDIAIKEECYKRVLNRKCSCGEHHYTNLNGEGTWIDITQEKIEVVKEVVEKSTLNPTLVYMPMYTFCANCGFGCSKDAIYHDEIVGGPEEDKQRSPCLVKFTTIGSLYMGLEKEIKERRPDLMFTEDNNRMKKPAHYRDVKKKPLPHTR